MLITKMLMEWMRWLGCDQTEAPCSRSASQAAPRQVHTASFLCPAALTELSLTFPRKRRAFAHRERQIK